MSTPSQRKRGTHRHARHSFPLWITRPEDRGTESVDPTLATSASTGILATCVASLLRKEVIQPHLPVRLPCYDFTPIANPTFGSSLPEGLGH